MVKKVHIYDKDEFNKLTDCGTHYKRTDVEVVATVVGDGDHRVNFVYEKE